LASQIAPLLGQAKQRLDVAALRKSFAEQVLPIGPALETFAEIKTHLRRLGRVVDSFDLLIGSTALFHGLTLVTHNTKHFVDMLSTCRIGLPTNKPRINPHRPSSPLPRPQERYDSFCPTIASPPRPLRPPLKKRELPV
jgi:hypothetical protein